MKLVILEPLGMSGERGKGNLQVGCVCTHVAEHTSLGFKL